MNRMKITIYYKSNISLKIILLKNIFLFMHKFLDFIP